MRVVPPDVASDDPEAVENVIRLLARRFGADVPCGCDNLACPQCEVYGLRNSLMKLLAFVKDE